MPAVAVAATGQVLRADPGYCLPEGREPAGAVRDRTTRAAGCGRGRSPWA